MIVNFAPLPGFAFHFDLSAVKLNDAPSFGEAEAEAAAGFAAGEEGIEEVAADFGRDARARVGDREQEVRSDWTRSAE